MNLAKRLFGGGLILISLILITYLGRPYFAIGFTIFSTIAVYELIKALANIGYNVPRRFALIINTFFMINAYFGDANVFIVGVIAILISIFVYMIFNKKFKIEDFFALLFVITYISIFMSNAIRIRDIRYLYMLYVIAWGSDTFAFISGVSIGRTKIKVLEEISPNKTVEGFLGGIIGAIVLNIIYVVVIGLDKNLLLVILFTMVSAILSETGDLVASFIKRKCKIKDYGNLIPGHGGILDRFDSILFISPCMFLFSLV